MLTGMAWHGLHGWTAWRGPRNHHGGWSQPRTSTLPIRMLWIVPILFSAEMVGIAQYQVAQTPLRRIKLRVGSDQTFCADSADCYRFWVFWVLACASQRLADSILCGFYCGIYYWSSIDRRVLSFGGLIKWECRNLSASYWLFHVYFPLPDVSCYSSCS